MVGDYQNDVTTDCGYPITREIANSFARVSAGDYLGFCQGPTGIASPATAVKVSIVDTPTNSVILSHTFTDIATCSS